MHLFGQSVVPGELARSLLAIAIASTLATGLVACGGGGGSNVRPVAPTSPPPPPPPTSPPPPPLIQPGIDAHLALIHATAGERQGYTGAGYRIGVIDTGVNRNHPALAGRVLANYIYVDRSKNDMSVDDKVGHGTTVSQLAAGQAFGNWPGGVAPGANILSARIINDERPTDDGSGQGNEVTGALGLKSIHQDLANAGMRIMNNSWGGLYWTRPTATAPIADEYRFFIQDRDGLVVFATGNESRPDPTNMAALPSQPGPNGSMPAADLEKGWLAVAALDTSNPTALMYYSNACGLARNYCLVAPGTAMFTGTNDTAGNPTYYYGSGTSYAAPLVSGAAAVVWQKFPYFNNDLVRQTLLGTATDLGDPGVDAVFGHGLLNLRRALDGPAKFDWGDVVVDFSGESTWNNAISGSGGLVKRGSGTLLLTTPSTYTGATRVEGGTLRMQGNIRLESAVTIAPGGTMAGYGGVAGLTNHGTLRVDDGVFNVHGNYVQGADGRLAIQLGNEFLVAGTASLAGELHVLGVRPGYTSTGKFNVLASNGVSGTFSSLTAAPGLFLQASLEYGTTHVWLDVQRLDVTATAMGLSGITAASFSAAQRIEAAFDGIDAQQAAGNGSIGEGFIRGAGEFQQIATADAARASLRSLSGEVHGAAMAATFDSMDLGRRALSTRFDALADGDERPGAWMQGLAGSGSAGGGDAQYSGWLAGQDFRLEGAFAGMAFGETRSDSRFEGLVDRSRERQAQAQLYLGRQWGQGYVLGRFGAGQWQRQIDRQLLLGASSYGLHSDYDGDFTSAGAEAGYRFDAGALSLVPYLATEHARVSSDGFREAGAAGFGLRNDGNVASRSQAIAGLRLQRGWGAFEVDGYAEWQQTLDSDGLELSASFVGVDAWSPLAADDPALSGGLFGVSARAWLTPRSALSFGYDQRFGPRGDARMASLRYVVGF